MNRGGDRWLGALTGVMLLAGCTPAPGPAAHGECVRPVAEDGTKGTGCLPTAPRDRRVDLRPPTFTHPDAVTNPLHPTASVYQAVYGGQADGKPFRSEVTLLPDRKTIEWGGRRIEALTSQYLALSDGRINEVALDWYAQADDGSVWYLGEDVFNYADGAVADTNGTWVADADTPGAMIMPAQPRPGDVYRTENDPPVVFEEVKVTAANRTVPGPSGPVHGAITNEELHLDGTREAKIFAPGYGEFSTGSPGGDLEAVELALPTDAVRTPVPPAVTALNQAAARAVATVSTGDWSAAAAAVGRAWTAARPKDLKQLVTQMDRDVGALTESATARDEPAARGAALRVSQNALDLRSRYEPVDRARFAMWARQLVADAAAHDEHGASGDLICLQWTFDRLRHAAPDAAAVEATLSAMATALKAGDLRTAARQARTLPA